MARESSVKTVQNGLVGLSLHNSGDNVSYIQAVDVSNSTYHTYDVYYHNNGIRTTVTLPWWINGLQMSTTISAISLNNLVVGFDIKWTRQRRDHNSARNKVAVLQLSLCRRCLIFQISWCHSIPESLHDFLRDEKFVFVGVGIDGDAHKIWLDYGITVARAEELGSLAAYKLTKTCKEYKESHFHKSGLRDLAMNVLGVELPKKSEIQLSNWNHCLLCRIYIHTEYACLDAFVSFRLGIRLRSLADPVHIEVNLGGETMEEKLDQKLNRFFKDFPEHIKIEQEETEKMQANCSSKANEKKVAMGQSPANANSCEDSTSRGQNFPPPQFFSDALVDKEKERVVIQYMKSRFGPAINMMLQVNQGLGFNGEENDLIRQLIKTAARNPLAFNFECRVLPPSD
ncbi:hypothetical protein MKX03_025129 [Papaver bracteatum]|nr:hypothetical protein MKX03_025129 [Papaver bracteatum]